MSPPTASEPLTYIVDQLKSDINRAEQKCAEIRTHHRAHSTKAQLEQLSDALRYGGSFMSNNYSAMSHDDNHSDTEAAEAALREDLVGFSRRMNDMIQKLGRYTYPFSVHHDHMHDSHSHHNHHHDHSHHHLLHDFVFGPHHHQYSSHDAHPHHHIDTFLANQVREWESIKDSISQAFARFNDKVAEKKREREEKEKRKKKAEEEKKAAVKKAQDLEKERTEREKERADKLAEKVKAIEAEQNATRQKQQQRQDKLEDKVHDLAEHAITSATEAVDHTVADHSPCRRRVRWVDRDADDDIDRLDHLARVINHLDLACHASHGQDRAATLPVSSASLNCNPASPLPIGCCADCWMESGVFTRHYPGHRHHNHWSSRGRPATVIGNEEEHIPSLVIQNNVHGAVDVEESSSLSGHGPRGSHLGLARHVPARTEEDSDIESVDTMTVRGGRGEFVYFGHANSHGRRHGHHARYLEDPGQYHRGSTFYTSRRRHGHPLV